MEKKIRKQILLCRKEEKDLQDYVEDGIESKYFDNAKFLMHNVPSFMYSCI